MRRLALLLCVLCLPSLAHADQVSVQLRQDVYRAQDALDGSVNVVIDVVNQGPGALENAIIDIDLPPSADATPLAARHGARKVWPVGGLQDGDRYTVSFTIPAGDVPTDGVSATLRGVVSGKANTWSSRALKMEPATFPVALLQATADADPADPVVAHQAAALGNDPQAIFRWVRDQIQHQPYEGSLHGARGVIYGGGANRIDRSNALVAMLRASGVPARYRTGTLSAAQKEQLGRALITQVQGMSRGAKSIVELRDAPRQALEEMMPWDAFALGTTMSERIAAVQDMSDAALEELVRVSLTDPRVQAYMDAQHVFVEAYIDGAWTSLDPSFASAQPGDTYATGGQTLEGIPQEWRHTVAVRIYHESMTVLTGSSLTTQAPTIETTLGAGDLVGRNIVATHRISSQEAGGLVFSSSSRTFTPSIQIRDAEGAGEFETLETTSFTELFSNFGGGIANTYITGVWLQVELMNPGQLPGEGESHLQAMADRIGFEGRNGEPVTITSEDFSKLLMDRLDVTSLMVQAAHTPLRIARSSQQLLDLTREAIQPTAELIETLPQTDPVQPETVEQATEFMRQFTSSLLSGYSGRMWERNKTLASGQGQVAYTTSPRVIAATGRVSPDAYPSVVIDLMSEKMLGLPQAGFPASSSYFFGAAYGLAASELESALLQTVQAAHVISADTIFERARQANLDIKMLKGQTGLVQLRAINMSAEARIRVTHALQAGILVVIPSDSIEFNGERRIAWFEASDDGHIIGRLDTGAGGAALSYATMLKSLVCEFLVPCIDTDATTIMTSIGAANGYLWGMIVTVVDFVAACTTQSDLDCNKLTNPAFSTAVANITDHAFKALTQQDEAEDGWGCEFSFFSFAGGFSDALDEFTGAPGPPAEFEGACAVIMAIMYAVETIQAALSDPVLPSRTTGTMDPERGDISDRYTAARKVSVASSLTPANITGSAPYDHLRLQGQSALSYTQAAPQPLLAETLSGTGQVSVNDQSLMGNPTWFGALNTIVVERATPWSHSGTGLLDAYANVLSGPTLIGTWSEATDVALGASTIGLDTRVRSGELSARAGLLTAGGIAAAPGVVSIDASTANANIQHFAALDAAATLTLTNGSGCAQLSAPGISRGGVAVGADLLSFANATGTATFSRTAAGDTVALDLTSANVATMTLSQSALSGFGRKSVAFAILASTTTDFLVNLRAPQGVRVGFVDDQSFFVEPTASLPDGIYTVELTATSPEGYCLSASLPYQFALPSEPVISLRVVDDTRYTIDEEGVRFPSRLLELTHWGRETGTYELSSSISDERLTATLGNQTLTFKPGESLRTGLVLGRGENQSWPAPGTPYEVLIEVTGSANAELRLDESMPASQGVKILGPEGLVMTEPGRTLSLTYYVESTGNVTANARLDVSSNPALTTRFTQPQGNILPGTTRAVVLELDIPAMQELPQTIDLTVALEATQFERDRELEPRAHKLRINVYPPGLGGLATVAIDAQNDRNYDLMRDVGRVLGTGTNAHSNCDQDAIDALIAALETLRQAYANDADAASFVETLDTQIAALGADGCAALGGLTGISSGIVEIAQRPNLVALITTAPSVINGEPHTFNLQVLNTGGSDAPPNAATLSIRRGAGASTLLERFEIPLLTPGASHQATFTWDTTSALGTYVAEFRVDVDKVVPESSETDNLRLAVVEVLPSDAAPADNSAPVFQGLPLTLVAAGSPYTYTPTIVDPDGDEVFLNAPVRPPGITLQGGTLSGVVPRPGTFPVVLVALDRYGAFSEQTFDLVVSEFGVDNHPPRVTSTPTRNALVGVEWTYDMSATDEDGDTFTFFDDALPSGMALTPTPDGARLTWTPTIDDPGTHWVSVRVIDEFGAETRHRFSLVVRQAPLGPDLAISNFDISDVTGATTRSGDARITIVNAGDAPAGANDLVLWEERDFIPGRSPDDVLAGSITVPALEPGERVELVVPVSGAVAFEGNILYAMVDALDAVEESNEDNNIRHSAQVDAPLVGTYVGFQDEPNDLILLASKDTAFRVVDPVTDETIEEGMLQAMVPTFVPVEIDESGNPAPLLDVFVVEADEPIQVYQNYEYLFANFGGDMFHVDVTGNRVGRDFMIFLPTLTPNNRLVITALEAGAVSLFDDAGELLDSLTLSRGQPWEPVGLSESQVYRVVATGDVHVHSASVTGMSVVPPANRIRAAAGDVGREFIFNTRARGPNGGAVAVFAYEDASYTITTESGVVLVNQSINANQHGFHYSLGENLGLVLRATGDVMVLGGDIARAGASTIDLMGEDITMVVGAGGRDIRVHSLQNDLGPSALLAGPGGAALQINGEQRALPPFGRLALASSQMHRILASDPVTVRLFGGGDRFYDYGDVLRAAPGEVPVAHPILDRFDLNAASCGATIEASVRVGNAGSGELPEDVRIELVELGVDGEVLVTSRSLGANLLPGQWQDVVLSGTTQTSGATQRTWLLRLANLPAGSPSAWTNGGTFESSDCQDAAPYFVSTPPTSVMSGAQLVYIAEAIDPEGKPLTYRLVQGPAGATVGLTSGALEWLATPMANTLNFAIEARDPAGNVAIQSFAIGLEYEQVPCIDNDGDGFCDFEDCDDNDPNVNPGAVEILGDGIDNDCNPATPDQVTPGTVRLGLYTDAPSFDAHDVVDLNVVFMNLSPLMPVGMGSVDVTVTCSNLVALQESMNAPALNAAASRTLRVPFNPDGNYEGRCTARANWMAGTELVARAETTFELGTAVAGFLTVEDMGTNVANLDWRLENRVDRALDVAMGLSSLSSATPYFQDIIGLPPMGTARGTYGIDTSTLAPGHYTMTLLVDGVIVARAPLVVGLGARVEARPRDGSSALGQPAMIEFQPMGPRPGGRRAGGTLRAGWTPTSILIELDTIDVTEDEGDLLVFRLVHNGELLETTYTGGAFAGDVDATLRQTADGARAFTFNLLAGDTPFAPGDEFALFVLIRDGDPRTPRGVWAFATDISEDYEDPGAYGVLALLEAGVDPDPDPNPGPDPDPDPDLDPDPNPDPNIDPDPDTDLGLENPDTVAGGCGCTTPAAPIDHGPARLILALLLIGLAWRRIGGAR